MGAKEVIMDAADIDRTLTRMTHKILEVHKGANGLTLIGIQTRGVYLARRMRAKIRDIEGTEVLTGDMDITLYRDDWTRISQHPVVQATDILFSVDGRQIILVDDVLFTGRTIRAAMDAIMDFGRPDRIELAVLVDRGYRELPIQADYVGRFVETRRAETVNVFLREHDGEDRVEIQRFPGGALPSHEAV
jgi:pyrimidine operon attenuation protein/uracil phosphoribosyltransferase